MSRAGDCGVADDLGAAGKDRELGGAARAGDGRNTEGGDCARLRRTVSDEDERAWCIVCGAEFCPNGRYADSDDQAEMCEGCESASAQRKALMYNATTLETPKPGALTPGSDLLKTPITEVSTTMPKTSTFPPAFPSPVPPLICVGGIVYFTHCDVFLDDRAADADPESLHAAVKLAFKHMRDPFLTEAWRAGTGPLAMLGSATLEEYLEVRSAAQAEIDRAAREKERDRKAKRKRRSRYEASRNHLIASMLSAGVPYRCAHDGCGETLKLTVDHIIPIAKGGTDDIDNLQFMCLRHNQLKGAH